MIFSDSPDFAPMHHDDFAAVFAMKFRVVQDPFIVFPDLLLVLIQVGTQTRPSGLLHRKTLLSRTSITNSGILEQAASARRSPREEFCISYGSSEPVAPSKMAQAVGAAKPRAGRP